MQVKVNRDLCEANAVCVGLAPEVFDLDDDEVLHITQPTSDAVEQRVLKAIDRCPKNALSI